MRKTLPLILAAAIDGSLPILDPTRASADDEDGYATMGGSELGYYDAAGNWVPADYATVGQLLRPGGGAMLRPTTPNAGPSRGPMRLPSPAQMRLIPGPSSPANPTFQAQLRAAGCDENRVRQIVAEMISRMAPYGQVPARVSPDEAMFPMGIGFTILSGGPPAVLTGTFTSLPQRAFRGERLVLQTLRSTGAATIPVIVDTFKVGDYSQLVGGAPVPVETFAPDSFGVRLMLDGAVPGVTYTIQVSVPAAIGIPAGETITVVGAVIGRAGEAAQR